MTKRVSILLFIATLVYGCARVPMTGRKQMKLLPESELVAMSLTSYKGFLDTSDVVSDGEQLDMVRRVGQRISQAVVNYLGSTRDSIYINQYDWEFNLVNDPTVNAWCMPGGKVVFYNGILPICKDETGVAVVMGHEIAHAIARHGNERMSQGLAQQLGGVALSVAVSEKSEETQSLFNLAYGVGTTVGVMLPFSRKHESEADYMGLMFMAMAGYNPEAAPQFWERMEAATEGGVRPPEFLSTHPNPSTRNQQLTEDMGEAKKFYQQYLDAQSN